MLLGEPGPPLNNAQTRALLDELYKMQDKPPVPMSGKRYQNDISFTESATHVYVKRENPQSLQPRFEGPYEIYSRPSRSTIQVKVGINKMSNTPRLLTFHWSSCKVAHMREGASTMTRPDRGRKPTESPEPPVLPTQITNVDTTEEDAVEKVNNQQGAKIQTRPNRTSRNPTPKYVF